MQTVEALLLDDHGQIDDLLKDAFGAVDAGAYGAAFDKLDLFWAHLAMHIRAEHLHLFPSILSRCGEGATTLNAHEILELLRDDHNFFMHELARAIKSLRAAGDEDAASTWGTVRAQLIHLRERLTEHNRIEETHVYPLLGALMDGVESDHLAGLLKKELDNLPPRFRTGESG